MITTLTEFLRARIAEDEAPTFELVPYRCLPGHCAPAGWVGHHCLICDDGTIYGGTVKAITESAREHEERFHRRARVLAECESKRRIVALHRLWRVPESNDDWLGGCKVCTDGGPVAQGWPCDTLRALVLPYATHPDFREEWGA